MDNSNPIPTDIFEAYEKREETLSASISFWENRRLLFNIVIAFSGIIGILSGSIKWSLSEVVLVAIYACVANLFYSLGFLIEAYIMHFTNGRILIHNQRQALFLIGTVGAAFLTFLLATL